LPPFYESGLLINPLKQAHPNIIFFVFWKSVLFRPAFFFQIRDNMLPGYQPSLFPKKNDGFPYPGLVMPDPAMAHLIFLRPLKFIQPEVNFFIGLAK
jgi:hypothetical protein